MVVHSLDNLRRVWADSLYQVGPRLLTDPALARTELLARYPAPSDADRADVDNLVAALHAGAYRLVERAPFREDAAAAMVAQLGVSEAQAVELVQVLAPDRLRTRGGPAPAVASAPTAGPTSTGPRRLAGALAVAALALAGGLVWAVLRIRHDGDRLDRLQAEVEQLRPASGQAAQARAAAAAAQAELEAAQRALDQLRRSTGGSDVGALVQRLQAAEQRVASLTKQRDAAVARAGTAAFEVAAGDLSTTEGQFAGTFTPDGACDGTGGCQAPTPFAATVQIRASGEHTVTLAVDGVLTATVHQTPTGVWAGEGTLQPAYSPVCDGATTSSAVGVLMAPTKLAADGAAKTVTITEVNLAIAESTPSCHGLAFGMHGTFTYRP